MISLKYLYESRKYSAKDIASELDIDQDSASMIFMNLIDLGMLSRKRDIDGQKQSDDKSFDIPCILKYVGLVVIGDLVIFCLPKIINCVPSHEEVKSLATCLLKASNSYDELDIVSNISESDPSIISTVLSILVDYSNNGFLKKSVASSSMDEGEIDWIQTIELCVPVFFHHKPFYLGPIYSVLQDDVTSPIYQIHLGIVHECLNIIHKMKLDTILDLSFIIPDSMPILSYDREFILSTIGSELSIEYDDIRKNTLALLDRYIRCINDYNSPGSILYHGTFSFYNIWETICRFSLGDDGGKLNSELSLAPLIDPTLLNRKLINTLDQPRWIIQSPEHGEFEPEIKERALIPDILVSDFEGGKNTLFIIDAKYYLFNIGNEEIDNYPGSGDLVKQQVYHLSLSEVFKRKFRILNIFVFPGQCDSITYVGNVSFPMFDSIDESARILLIKLPWLGLVQSFNSSRPIGLSGIKSELKKNGYYN